MRYGMPTTETEWQAESDARILADAELIKSDPKRLAKSEAMAKQIAEQKTKEVKAMKMISDGKAFYNNSPDMGE